MDALHQEYRAVVELQRLLVPLSQTGDEIIAWQHYRLARKESAQVVVEEFEVDSLQCLIVVVATLIAWGLGAVDKIVVERYALGVETEHSESNAESFAEGCLAARRGAGNQHHTHSALCVSLGNRVGNLANLLLVQGFGNLNKSCTLAVANHLIQRTHIRHADNIYPILILAEYLVHLLLWYHIFEH